jgi:hypothetical protein
MCRSISVLFRIYKTCDGLLTGSPARINQTVTHCGPVVRLKMGNRSRGFLGPVFDGRGGLIPRGGNAENEDGTV